jgi:hypothetical protein
MPAPSYQAGVDNTERLLRTPIAPLTVGRFDAAPGVDRPLNVRGSVLQGGTDGTFAGYIRDALSTELATASRLAADGPARVSGTLLHNDLHASSAEGGATIRMRFRVDREGRVAYERELTAEHRWESSFMGAIAIPAAMNNYAGAVQKLIGMLFDDPAFQQATAAPR